VTIKLSFQSRNFLVECLTVVLLFLFSDNYDKYVLFVLIKSNVRSKVFKI